MTCSILGRLPRQAIPAALLPTKKLRIADLDQSLKETSTHPQEWREECTKGTGHAVSPGS